MQQLLCQISAYATQAQPTPWYRDGILLATWAGVVVNGILMALTLWFLIVSRNHNNRTFAQSTRRAVPELLRPAPDTVCCIAAPIATGQTLASAYWYRLAIRMEQAPGHDVEVFGVSLHQFDESTNAWAPVPGWIPSQFLWQTEPRQFANPTMPEDSVRWCNFGHIVDPACAVEFGDAPAVIGHTPDPALHLQLAAKSYRRNNVLAPGKYKLRVEISGRNVSVRRWNLAFVVSSLWKDDLDYMSACGVAFEEPVDLDRLLDAR